MRVVINTSVLLSPTTGVGTYVYETARALAAVGGHDYTYYDGRFSGTLPDPSKPSGRRLARGVKRALDQFPAARGLARNVGQAFLPVATRWQTGMSAPPSFDVYWEPNYIPLALDAKRLIITVHDLSVTTHPEWHPKDRVAHYARHFRAGLDRADVIAAASEFTKRELVDLLRVDPSRVRVIYPGCDLKRFRSGRKSGTGAVFPPRFVLAVGSPKDTRKNLARLIEAWGWLSESLRKEFQLAIAGPLPSASRRTSSLKSQASGPLYLGYLTRDDLAAAYASATALVYPSLYEGFGLPPLEAMASGCPAVASDIPPVREVCGNAAELVDPASPESIAAGLTRVLESDSLRREMSAKGLVRAKLFPWSRTAQELLQTFA